MTCARRQLVDDHFAHRTDEQSERALREHLDTCVECNAWYERHLLFGTLTGEHPAHERLMRPFGLSGRAGPSAWRRALVPIAAAAVLVLVLVLAVSLVRIRDDGFTARGSGATGVGLDVFRVAKGARPTRLETTMKPADSLSFSYQNAAGKKWLMIFAVDSSGGVYWYHPAWERAEDTPLAIPLQADAQWHELEEAVTQPLPPGRIELRALFLDERLDVKQAEAALGRPVTGALEVRRTLEVLP